MVAEIFFLFLTENSKQNNPMEQKRQEYHDREQSSSEETEDNSEINPKDGRSALAAHQAQVKWEEVYPFAFYFASYQEWFCRICQQYAGGVNWVSETVNF